MDRLLVVATLTVLAGPLAVAGQTEADRPGREPTIFLAGGLGLGTPGVGGHLSVSMSRPSHDLILRLAETSDFDILRTSETTRDIALLLGRRRESPRGWARAAVGIAHVRRTERGELIECRFPVCRYEEVPSFTMGLAAEVDLVWAPRESIGLGLTGLGNLNTLEPFAAATITLFLGGVRSGDGGP